MLRRFALAGALHSYARLACVRVRDALLDASASAKPFSPAAREVVGCGDVDHIVVLIFILNINIRSAVLNINIQFTSSAH